MVKLASARENRMYGPRLSRNRSEYINAGLYVFATILLVCGFAAQFSQEPKSGLVLLLIALALIAIVNLHDLFAHLAAIDYRLSLIEFDTQLALVEFAVPVVHTLGAILSFLGFLFLFLQAERGRGYLSLEQHALNMIIGGAALWVLGSIHNSCQIYERADGHVQMLQESVCLPFLMGSLLFLVGAVLNIREQAGYYHHGLGLLGGVFIWLGLFGSLLLLMGGLTNVAKVFKMQQMNGLRLEKLRGGAQERLVQLREGQAPLIVDESRRRKGLADESEFTVGIIVDQSRRKGPVEQQQQQGKSTVGPTPYKDVLIGHS